MCVCVHTLITGTVVSLALSGVPVLGAIPTGLPEFIIGSGGCGSEAKHEPVQALAAALARLSFF